MVLVISRETRLNIVLLFDILALLSVRRIPTNRCTFFLQFFAHIGQTHRIKSPKFVSLSWTVPELLDYIDFHIGNCFSFFFQTLACS